LRQRQGVQLLGDPQLALASFTVPGLHGSDLAHLLSEQGICVRNGHHCAMPLLKQLGLSGALRVSLGLYTNGADLQRFFSALDQALEILR
jgi:cysteine sulfinate desulfinase